MNERVVVELTVDARGASTGTAEFERAMTKASAAVDKVKAKTTDLRLDSNLPRSVDRVTQSFDKLKASIDPVARATYQAQMEMRRAMALTDRAVLTGVATQQQAAAAISGIRTRQIADIERVKLAQAKLNVEVNQSHGGSSMNAASQFQDIAITAAMGQSIPTIMLQQGSQLGMALESGMAPGMKGIKGLVGGLGAAFMGLVTPVNLIAIAIAGAAAGAIQFGRAMLDDSDDIDAALKGHKDLIDEIAKSFPNAAEAARAYEEQALKLPQSVAAADVLGQKQEETDLLKSKIEDLAGTMDILRYNFSTMGASGTYTFGLLGDQLRSGVISAREFSERLGNIRLNPDAPTNVKNAAAALQEAANEAATLEAALNGSAAAAERLARTTGKTNRLGFDAQADFDKEVAMRRRLYPDKFPSRTNIDDGTTRVGSGTRTIYDIGGGTDIGVTRFASGGFTGHRPTDQIAGVVHGGEFVMDAATTARVGVGNLEAIRRGVRGFAAGGAVGDMASLMGGATVELIEQHTYDSLMELKRIPGYLETLTSDGEAALTVLKSISDGVKALESAKSYYSGGGTGGGSSATTSGRSGGFGGGGTSFDHNDPNSPYYFSGRDPRSGAVYDPVADFTFNGNKGALGSIAGSAYGPYEATPWNSPFDVSHASFTSNVELADRLGRQGPSVGQGGGSLNLGGSAFAGNVGNRVRTGGGGMTDAQARAGQLSDIKQYGYATGGYIHPGDTQKVEFYKNPNEAVEILTPAQQRAKGEGGGGNKTINVNISLADPGTRQSQLAMADQVARQVRMALSRP